MMFRARLHSSVYDPLDTGVFITYRPYGSEKTYRLTGLKWAELKDGYGALPEGAGHLSHEGVPAQQWEFPQRDFMQAVFDGMWEQGFRPSSGKLETSATDKHLEDMRKIVFHKLGIKE